MALKWLKVEDVWGIGRQHAKRLNSIGVNTANDFTLLDDQWVQSHMSIVGLRLQHDLQGIPTLDLDETQPKKNIATTRSFDTNYTTKAEVKERITTFAVTCAEKLRAQSSCCSSLMVFIQTNRHHADKPQYSRNIAIKLPFPTNSSIELAHFAGLALDRIYKPGYGYKRAGVIIQDFTPQAIQQVSLFDNRNEAHIPLMETMDKLNKAFGQQKIKLGGQDIKKVWKMRQEKLSPRYTTKLSDIITVRC